MVELGRGIVVAAALVALIFIVAIIVVVRAVLNVRRVGGVAELLGCCIPRRRAISARPAPLGRGRQSIGGFVSVEIQLVRLGV
jgi:hypothetical protein